MPHLPASAARGVIARVGCEAREHVSFQDALARAAVP
jgi:hypothetical protein